MFRFVPRTSSPCVLFGKSANGESIGLQRRMARASARDRHEDVLFVTKSTQYPVALFPLHRQAQGLTCL